MNKNSIIHYIRRTGFLTYNFLLKEYKSKASPQLIKKLNLWRWGFIGESNYLYNFNKYPKKVYLTDLDRLKTKFINGDYEFILNNKLVFQSIIGSEIKMPKIKGVIWGGEIILMENGDKKVKKDYIFELLRSKKRLILKPISMGGGRGVKLIEYKNNRYYIDRKKLTKHELLTFVGNLDRYLISEYVVQANYINKIFPYSTNTLRILMYRNPQNLKAEVACAVHRFGMHKTQPTDNWSKGGLSAFVNKDSGKIGKAAVFDSKNKRINMVSRHPVTGVKIEGCIIPNYKQIFKKLTSALDKLPNINYIGWDIVITDKGFTVLEANNFSDVNLLQVHKPLLLDYKLKSFYQRHNVITRK